MEIKEDAFSENSSEENDENPEKIRLVVISSKWYNKDPYKCNIFKKFKHGRHCNTYERRNKRI